MKVFNRIAARFSRNLKWWRVLGTRSTLRWGLICLGRKLGMAEPESWRARPRPVQHALTQRLRGCSDHDVFSQIFVAEEYASLKNLKDVSLVFDLGANVGYSSAYFLGCFPKARLVAVEPDNRNIVVCRLNLEPYGQRALVLHGAVWSEPTTLNLSQGTFGDGREWATQVSELTEGGVGDTQAWDVGSLIEMAAATQVDLLKVDIERAELAVFGETAGAWLPKVRNICVELHGPDCEDSFFRALADYDYELQHSGELTICRSIRAKVTEPISIKN